MTFCTACFKSRYCPPKVSAAGPPSPTGWLDMKIFYSLPGGGGIYEKEGALERIVSGERIAEVLGLTERRIRQLRQQGVLRSNSAGNYLLNESVQAYIEFVTKGTDGSGNSAALDLTRERAGLMKAKREDQEYELALKRGDLHRSSEIRQVMSAVFGNFRSRLLSIPAKASPVVAVKSNKAEIYQYLKELIDEALNELADFDKLFPEQGAGIERRKDTDDIPKE